MLGQGSTRFPPFSQTIVFVFHKGDGFSNEVYESMGGWKSYLKTLLLRFEIKY